MPACSSHSFQTHIAANQFLLAGPHTRFLGRFSSTVYHPQTQRLSKQQAMAHPNCEDHFSSTSLREDTSSTADNHSPKEPISFRSTACISVASHVNDASFKFTLLFTDNIAAFYNTMTDQPSDTWYCPNPYGGCEGTLNMTWQTRCPICGAERPK